MKNGGSDLTRDNSHRIVTSQKRGCYTGQSLFSTVLISSYKRGNPGLQCVWQIFLHYLRTSGLKQKESHVPWQPFPYKTNNPKTNGSCCFLIGKHLSNSCIRRADSWSLYNLQKVHKKQNEKIITLHIYQHHHHHHQFGEKGEWKRRFLASLRFGLSHHFALQGDQRDSWEKADAAQLCFPASRSCAISAPSSNGNRKAAPIKARRKGRWPLSSLLPTCKWSGSFQGNSQISSLASMAARKVAN